MTTKTKSKTTTQTVRIAGVRTILTTRNGKVSAKAALPLEWTLQASQCRRLRDMADYAPTAEAVLAGKGRFTLAGDQNASKRGAQAAMQAIASGMVSGEPDVRIYLEGARLGLIENKVGSAKLSGEQVKRHALLRVLGFDVRVVRATTEDDAADQAEAIVRGWLAANDNHAVAANSPVIAQKRAVGGNRG